MSNEKKMDFYSLMSVVDAGTKAMIKAIFDDKQDLHGWTYEEYLLEYTAIMTEAASLRKQEWLN